MLSSPRRSATENALLAEQASLLTSLQSTLDKTRTSTPATVNPTLLSTAPLPPPTPQAAAAQAEHRLGAGGAGGLFGSQFGRAMTPMASHSIPPPTTGISTDDTVTARAMRTLSETQQRMQQQAAHIERLQAAAQHGRTHSATPPAVMDGEGHQLEAVVADLQAQLNELRTGGQAAGRQSGGSVASAGGARSPASGLVVKREASPYEAEGKLLGARSSNLVEPGGIEEWRARLEEAEANAREHAARAQALEEERRAWREEMAADKSRLRELEASLAKLTKEKGWLQASIEDMKVNAERRAAETLAVRVMSRDAAAAAAARPSVELLRENERLHHELREMQREGDRRAHERMEAMVAMS